ncbi:lysylphosphatidylglycerol synthase domain-containing protein [Acinetobacter nematophilus]|uniref:lysylphosphatidylglycerol synthase domain-containing protein n=1 Tax=Acinetobacter nematophilus TaxID=2994642 RepID=UPI003AF4A523
MSEQIDRNSNHQLGSRRKYIPQVLLSIAIILYVVAIEWWFGWLQIFKAWKHVPILYLIVSLILMQMTYLIRGWRIHDFFLPITRGQGMTCCRIMLIHNLLNNLLPFRSGEISFPLLMRRHFTLSLSYATAGLLLLRILDLQVLLGLGFLILLLLEHSNNLGLWGLMLLWLISPLILLFFTPWLKRFSEQLSTQGRLKNLLEHVLLAMPLHFKSLLRSWLFTLICWLSKIMVFAVVLDWFISLHWWETAAVSIGGELSSVLPIHAPAGLGTYEVAILATGKLLNLSETKALFFAAVQLHLLILISTLFGGLIALCLPAQVQFSDKSETNKNGEKEKID